MTQKTPVASLTLESKIAAATLAPEFSSFGLNEDLLKGVREAGFTSPSPIQVLAIPQIIAGRDIIAQARTGTGKTAAFGLALMNKLKRKGGVEILIMTPTRELAAQISDELFKLGRFAGIKTAAVYGGQSGFHQIDLIRRGANIVVATPGRMLDHLSSQRLPNFKPSMVVLDEADEMLDMGFIDDIRAIFEFLPKERQTLFFSATMPAPIRRLANDVLNDPAVIDISSQEMTSVNIEQGYCVVEESERPAAIARLIDGEAPEKAIIFCRTKRETDDLCTSLISRGFKTRALHGDIDQPQRQDVIKGFRAGNISILVATDVAARGLDVSGVSHVFNYHLPFDTESYIHRIGRTGRAGAKGRAITLVTPYEFRKLRQIQHEIKVAFSPAEVPSKADLGRMHDSKLVEQLLSQEVRNEALELLNTLSEKMDLTQIACKLISMVQNQRVIQGPDQIGLSKKELKELESRRGAPPRRQSRYDNRRPPDRRSGGQSYGNNRRSVNDGPRSNSSRPPERSFGGSRSGGAQSQGQRRPPQAPHSAPKSHSKP
jgi:ATP-dependent RNA helicase DeaD